jgi:hypothetical protein
MFSHLFALKAVARTLALSGFLLGAMALVTAAPVQSRAAIRASAAVYSGTEHIWVYNSENVAVDVSGSLITDLYGNNYVSVDGVYIGVVLDHQESHVYGLYDNLIGYITS